MKSLSCKVAVDYFLQKFAAELTEALTLEFVCPEDWKRQPTADHQIDKILSASVVTSPVPVCSALQNHQSPPHSQILTLIDAP